MSASERASRLMIGLFIDGEMVMSRSVMVCGSRMSSMHEIEEFEAVGCGVPASQKVGGPLHRK